MNSSVKLCVSSTLSTELTRFKLSPSTYGILMGVCVTNAVLSPVAVLGNGLVLVASGSSHNCTQIQIFSSFLWL